MRTTLYLLALLALPAFAGQTVYKWVDEKGVTHFSDMPMPGATKVEISSGNRAEPQPAYTSSPAATSRSSASRATYNISITQPANGETFSGTGGNVSVNIRLSPSLQSGDQLAVYLDGREVQRGSTSFDLQNVPRGEHRLVAVIEDERRTRVQEAGVSFTVLQQSVANPPVGPALKPPPKPTPRPGNKPATSQPTRANLHGAPPKIDPATNLPVKKPATPPPPPKGG